MASELPHQSARKGVPTGAAREHLDHRCEACGAAVWRCNNAVYLEQEIVDDPREWYLMPVGTMILAAAGAGPAGVARYRLHEHEPPEGDDG